jgi:DNA polymerase III delta prime subunit
VWVLDHSAYKAWLSGSIPHLWLCGKAGCGKTILASTIVEDVEHHCRQAVGFRFAPSYFTFSDKGKQSYEALLRSLLAQPGIPELGLATLREKYDQRHKLQGGLSVQRFETILLVALAAYYTVFVVLDAPDECSEEDDARFKLLSGLETLTKGQDNPKIMVTSRDVPDIHDSLEYLPAKPLPVMTRAVDRDIHDYIAQQLSRGQYLQRLKRETLDLIQTTITAKADGM